jgi:hypothetical protein
MEGEKEYINQQLSPSNVCYYFCSTSEKRAEKKLFLEKCYQSDSIHSVISRVHVNWPKIYFGAIRGVVNALKFADEYTLHHR